MRKSIILVVVATIAAGVMVGCSGSTAEGDTKMSTTPNDKGAQLPDEKSGEPQKPTAGANNSEPDPQGPGATQSGAPSTPEGGGSTKTSGADPDTNPKSPPPPPPPIEPPSEHTKSGN